MLPSLVMEAVFVTTVKYKWPFELKCPRPGKERTTDVHYEIPKYYITQLLRWQQICVANFVTSVIALKIQL